MAWKSSLPEHLQVAGRAHVDSPVDNRGGGDDGRAEIVGRLHVEGVARQVNVGMLEEPPVGGQWVIIHLGFAVELTDRAGADSAMSGLELISSSGAGGAPSSPIERRR